MMLYLEHHWYTHRSSNYMDGVFPRLKYSDKCNEHKREIAIFAFNFKEKDRQCVSRDEWQERYI